MSNHIITSSLIDYEGKNALVTFNGECNFACPSCYAKKLMTRDKNYDWTQYLGDWNDGIVFLGCEPTLDIMLEEDCRKAKRLGLAIKLDTNGSNPAVLANLLEKKLVDYIALDIKASPTLYNNAIGKRKFDIKNIERSIGLATRFPDYEFRTTIVPINFNPGIDWMNPKEFEEMARWIYHLADNQSNWYLQKFIAMDEDDMIDKRFAKNNIGTNYLETPDEIMTRNLAILKKYFPNAKIR